MLKTISEVKETGWNALVERLGVAGATLFILGNMRRVMVIILRKGRKFLTRKNWMRLLKRSRGNNFF
jgi:hypothetical protein